MGTFLHRHIWVCIMVMVVFVAGPVQAARHKYNNRHDAARSTPTEADRYVYKAKIKRVIDGDTVVADVSLGFNTWRHDERLRLNRINAPEIRGHNKTKTCRNLRRYPGSRAGCISYTFLRDRIEGKTLLIRTVKNRKGREHRGGFGRYLVEVYLEGVNLNDEMLELKLAEKYVRRKRRKKSGAGRRPIPVRYKLQR